MSSALLNYGREYEEVVFMGVFEPNDIVCASETGGCCL